MEIKTSLVTKEPKNEQSKGYECRAVVPSSSSGGGFLVSRRGPLRHEGAVWGTKRRLGKLAIICRLRRETELVCPESCHPRSRLGRATLGELLVALGLLIGWQLRWVALAGGSPLLSFAVTMTMALGIKAPLDFSVFGAAAGAFLLAAICNESVYRGLTDR